MSKFDLIFYYFCKFFLYIFFKIFGRLKVNGIKNIPKKGRVILASNHISFLDPPVIGVSANRILYALAKKELFEIPVLGWIIKHLNGIPLNREEHDIKAFKTVHRLLEKDNAILIFPEGTRVRKKDFGEPKQGVGMLACKTNSPVIPVYVENTEKFLCFKKIKVCFGQPIYYDNKFPKRYLEFSQLVIKKISELKNNR